LTSCPKIRTKTNRPSDIRLKKRMPLGILFNKLILLITTRITPKAADKKAKYFIKKFEKLALVEW
jgi:hypothetical protein